MTTGDSQAPERVRLQRRGLARLIRRLTAVASVSVVLLLAALILAVPALERKPEVLAQWLSDYFEREVALSGFELLWSDGSPLLRIRDLRLVEEDQSSALKLETTEVRVDAMRSLRDRSIRPQAITVRGVHVGIERAEDGTLSVTGFGQRNDTDLDELFRQLVETLPDDASLGIEQATLTLNGFESTNNVPTPVTLFPVTVRLARDNDILRLSATAAFQDHPGAPLRATLRWPERDATPLAAGEFTISTKSLSLAALPASLRPQQVNGKLSFAVDGQIVNESINNMRGTLKLAQLAVGQGLPKLPFDGIHSLLEYVEADRDWRLTLLRLQSQSAAGLSTPSTVTVDGRRHSAPHTVRLDHMQVGTVLPLLIALAPASDALSFLPRVLTPAGRIENLALDLTGELSALSAVQLHMNVRDAVLRSDEHGLNMGPADAVLSVGAKGGSVQLQATPARIDIARPSDIPLQARFMVRGTLNWQHSGSGLLLHSDGFDLADGDLRLRAAGTAHFPADEAPPELDVQLRGNSLDAATFHRWLNFRLLPAALTDWLSQAIVAGRLTSLDARFQGSPGSAQTSLEQLDLRATFEDTTLRYLEDWPELTAMSGEFALKGRQFTFTVNDALVNSASIAETRGEIPDVLDDHPVLNLQGNAHGRAEQAAAFLSATPLRGEFAALMKQLNATGNATLQLQVTVPLVEQSINVRGKLLLRDNELKISALRSALSKVSGTIGFDARGLTQAALKARYLQRDIAVSMDGMLGARSKTRLVINGDTDPQGLLQHLWDVGAIDSKEKSALPLLSRLSGRAKWQVTLDIAQRPPNAQRDLAANIDLTVRSDLKGMALNLPSPLGKVAQDTRVLVIRSKFSNSTDPDAAKNRQFRLQYGETLHGIVEMRPLSEPGFVLRRGALQLGGKQPTLDTQAGIVVKGTVAVISVDEWAALIAELEAPATAPHTPRALDHIKSIHVEAHRLVALGAVFDDVVLKVARDSGGPWRISTNGSGINGSIAIPEPIGKTPIDARFQRLHVRRDAGPSSDNSDEAPITIDPRGLPSAQVVVQRLRYNDIELGLAKLVLNPADDGISIAEIYALSEAFELRGTGHWAGPANSARSRFDLRLHSNDFGQFTKALGYGDSGIEGGVAEVAINANWDGSPFAFALDHVQGQLHFRGTGGRLLDVEPGATGRVFGLLNVTVLPRRLLLLDFKDLFEEGVAYELIEGSFALADGDALTDNVVMQTQTAQVALTGRVGLVAQDYDQVMTVTPKLSASLPLAPIWLAEKLFNRKLIDNAFAYQYVITGSWDEPSIERVRVEAVRPEPR